MINVTTVRYKLQYKETSGTWVNMNKYRGLSQVKANFYLELCRLSQSMVYNPREVRAVLDD